MPLTAVCARFGSYSYTLDGSTGGLMISKLEISRDKNYTNYGQFFLYVPVAALRHVLTVALTSDLMA